MNRRAEYFRNEWYRRAAEWHEPIENPQQLFDQNQTVDALQNSLDFLYARGAPAWELERAAFGCRAFQKSDDLPSIEACDFLRDGKPAYRPVPPEFADIDRIELERGNLHRVPYINVKYPISRFPLKKEGSTTKTREISDGSVFTRVHESFPFQMSSVNDILQKYGPDAVVFLLDVMKAFKNIAVIPKDIFNFGFLVELDGELF